MRIQMRRSGAAIAMTALLGLALAPAALAEQLPPNNTDWLLTAKQASTVTGSSVPLSVAKVKLTPAMWSQSFVAPGSAEPRAGVTLLHYTNPKPLTQVIFGKLSQGANFGADVAQGYECTKVPEATLVPGRIRFTRVCWNDGLVISAATVKVGTWILGGWSTVRPAAGETVTQAMKDKAIADARALRAAQGAKLVKNLK